MSKIGKAAFAFVLLQLAWIGSLAADVCAPPFEDGTALKDGTDFVHITSITVEGDDTDPFTQQQLLDLLALTVGDAAEAWNSCSGTHTGDKPLLTLQNPPQDAQVVEASVVWNDETQLSSGDCASEACGCWAWETEYNQQTQQHDVVGGTIYLYTSTLSPGGDHVSACAMGTGLYEEILSGILHEGGHVLGLDHPVKGNAAACTSANRVMAPNPSPLYDQDGNPYVPQGGTATQQRM